MPDVRKISWKDRPSPYSNHVLIQRTAGGSVHASGATNRGNVVKRFSPPHFADIETAVAAGRAWADENGVPTIFVCEDVNQRL